MTPSFQRTVFHPTSTELITRLDRICHHIHNKHSSIRIPHGASGSSKTRTSRTVFLLHFFRTRPSSSYSRAIWSQVVRPNSSPTLPPRFFTSSSTSMDFPVEIAFIIIVIDRMPYIALASGLFWPLSPPLDLAVPRQKLRHPTG